MNQAILIGRLTRDPEMRYTAENKPIARFTVAVDRRTKREGEQNADFIPCVAFNKMAEFLEKYFRKGMKIGLEGRIQTGSYVDREGRKVYTTDVIVSNVEFVESKRQEDTQYRPAETQSPLGDGFMNIPEGIDDEGLPFN